jgi:CheY-like chemotaxis protein
LEQLLEQRRDYDAILVDAEMETEDGRNLAQHLRAVGPTAKLPIFRLFGVPSHAVLSIPVEDRMTTNLSKLDRQNLLNTLASILAAHEPSENAKELAA